MSKIDDQIEALKEAIFSGAKKVIFRSGGTYREIEYQSQEEMFRALASLEGAKKTPRRVTLAKF